MLSHKAFIALALLLGVCAAAAPLHLLFLARYPMVMFQGQKSLAGVLVAPSDLLMGLVLLALFLRGRPKTDGERHRWPYMLPWIALGLLISLSYLKAPGTQENLTALHRVVYQLYRYCWKGLLIYPLALLLLDNRVKMERALVAVVLAGDLVAAYATLQVYFQNAEAVGPFRTSNQLGGCLVPALILSLIGLLAPQARYRAFWIGSTLLILRGLLFTGSRSAIVAVTVGACFCGAWLLTRRAGRSRIARLIPAALIAVALLFAIKPDVLQRPTIRRAFTARQGTSAGTFQWRVQERWPHFVERIQENPWLGFGTDVHPELVGGTRFGAPTPHNGYLSLAVTHGIPAASLYLLMALLALRNGLRLFARSDDPWVSALGLLMAGALVAVLVQNLAEATIGLPFVRDIFWLLCALCAQGALVLSPTSREAPKAAAAGVLAHGMSR